jgi:hypothetical protein
VIAIRRRLSQIGVRGDLIADHAVFSADQANLQLRHRHLILSL